MVDGFQGYDKLKNVKRCACYAHIRRYFLDALPKGSEKDLSKPAVQGMAYCDKLFRCERRYKEQGLSYEQRLKRRLKDEKPVVEAFTKWLGGESLICRLISTNAIASFPNSFLRFSTRIIFLFLLRYYLSSTVSVKQRRIQVPEAYKSMPRHRRYRNHRSSCHWMRLFSDKLLKQRNFG